MPITRTAMIDDDGSGTTGTIINNAWKQEIYNQIDAFVGGPLITVPFLASDFSANNGAVWTVTGAPMKYAVIAGRWVYVTGAITASTLSGPAPTSLGVKIPGGLINAAQVVGVAKISHSTLAWENMIAECVAGGTAFTFNRSGYAPFGAGAVAGYFSILIVV